MESFLKSIAACPCTALAHLHIQMLLYRQPLHPVDHDRVYQSKYVEAFKYEMKAEKDIKPI